MEILYLIIGAILGGIIGFLIGKNKAKGNSSESGNAELKADLKMHIQLYEDSKLDNRKKEEILINKQNEIQELTGIKAKLDAELEGLKDKLNTQKADIDKLNEKFSIEFKNLANQILEEKSKKFTETNKENINTILSPLKQSIKDFEEKAEKNYEKELRERVSLKTEISQLIKLNKQLSDDATNLATALKGESKTQGDWGEMQLELILEKSGLQKNIHYITQEGHRDEEGALKKPDFIINLPENKHLVIDSKVSLTSYERYFNTEEIENTDQHLKDHINSLRSHIKDLSSKKYHDLYNINTPDFVLMFVPIEGAFNLAVQNDDKLMLDALEKNVVIVTTSTLLATLTTVSSIWKQENQKKNVLEIARQGGALYDKFVNFTEDLLKIGKDMDNSKKSYVAAMNKLTDGTGNLIGRAQKIKDLGIKTNKKMDERLLNRSIESFNEEE